MPIARANGLSIAYESHGDASRPPILLIMGLGAQLTLWPEAFVDTLVGQGFHVVRHDNRDVGLSSDFGHWGKADLAAAVPRVLMGQPIEAPYRIDDMAADAIGLMDSLGLARVHVVGLSMGGMIAQTMAGKHPDRCLSLTSIMSTSSRSGLPPGKPEAMAALLTRPESEDREVVVQYSMKLRRIIGGSKFGYDEVELRALVERNVDRRYYPEGVGRQYLAVMASGDRVELLQRIRRPTLVVHGSDDPLLLPACGEDVARLVPGARLEIVDGMGHDIPPVLAPRIAQLVAGHCRAATPGA